MEKADEMAIRMYASGHDFPRTHAQDLVVRLGMDESKEECHKQLCDMIEQCIRSALAYDGDFRCNRAFLKEMLPGSLPGNPIGFGSATQLARLGNAPSNKLGNGFSNGPASGLSVNSHCMRDVVTIVSREAKNMVVKIAKECEGKTYHSVPRFAEKILAICWISETLLAARVAEEFVRCFVHLHSLAKILGLIDSPPNGHIFEDGVKPGEARNAAVELAKLVLVIYQEVAAGNLLLKTPERVALLENWHLVLGKLFVGGKCNFDQPTKDLFMTLPLKQQILLVNSRKDNCSYESYISTSSLAKFVKKHWPTVEVKLVQTLTDENMHIEQGDVGCKTT